MEPGSSPGPLVKGQGEQAQGAAAGRAVRGQAGCCPRKGGQPWGGSAFLEAVGACLALPGQRSEQRPLGPSLPPLLSDSVV